MTVLQIDVQGTDADGNTTTGMIEVQVTEPPPAGSKPVMVVPPAMQTSVTMPPGAIETTKNEPPAQHPFPVAEKDAQVQAPRFAEKTPSPIAGFTNAVLSGHMGAQPTGPAPKVPQVVRSTTLFRNTGGFR